MALYLGDKLGTVAAALKPMLEEERIGDRHQVNISVRVFCKSSGKFANLAHATTMRTLRADARENYLLAETSCGVVHNFRHIVDAPEAEARVPTFQTKMVIVCASFYGKPHPYLIIRFYDGSNEPVVHPTRILDVMERLDWKPDFNMDINNANELDDVNFGALAIADGNNNEVGAGKNVAEHLRVPVDHPMAFFFNDDESGVAMKIVLFGGIRVAGKIRRTTKWFWDLCGGDDNWNKLLAVHTHALTYRGLGLGKLGADTSMDFLKRLLTDAPAAPLPPPKPILTYSFELKFDILGKKLHSFVPVSYTSGGSIFIPVVSSYGDHLVRASKEDGEAPGTVRIIDGSLDVRVFDRSTRKFASLARTETMRMCDTPAGPFFLSEEDCILIHDHCDIIDHPAASPRTPMFHARANILFCEDGIARVRIAFIDIHGERVESDEQILRLMERLEWK